MSHLASMQKVIINFQFLITIGLSSLEWVNFIAHLIWGNSSHASYNVQIDHNLHQNDISGDSFFTGSPPCLGKQTKSFLLLADWYEWVVQKEMVDAFIKYGNLLNGLWQSHWRSLFRCRWLPAYWLPLTVADACHEKRESCSLLFLCLFVFF